MKKIFIVGLDGATWDLIDNNNYKDKLPNISIIKNNGCWGKLRSTIPPATGTAWPSFSTGCNPDKHGIFDFVKFDKSINNRVVTIDDIRIPTIFEKLDKVGKRTIIINHPLTYGLKPENGIIFADFLSPEAYAHPKKEEENLKDYRLFWDRKNLIKSDVDTITKDIIDVESKRLNLVLRMIDKKWDLFFVLFSGTDWISHRFFTDMMNGSDVGKKAFRVFEFSDFAIGKILEKIDEDTVLFLVSDHGFNSKKISFDINRWLLERGYLNYEKMDKNSNFNTLSELRKKQNGKKEFYSKFKKFIDMKISKIDYKEKYIIDYNSSQAFIPTHNCFGIYINKEKISNHEEFAKGLIYELRKVSYPQTKEPVFSFVDSTNNIYNKNNPDAPDILFLLNKGFSHKCVTKYNVKKTTKIFNKMNGDDHSIYGIFAAYGKNVKKREIKNINIIDVAPTILNLLKYEIPGYVDGKSFVDELTGQENDGLKIWIKTPIVHNKLR